MKSVFLTIQQCIPLANIEGNLTLLEQECHERIFGDNFQNSKPVHSHCGSDVV